MDKENLISTVFQGKWYVENVIDEKSIATGNGGIIVTFKVIVHDISDPLVKYSAKISGIEDDGVWDFTLGIPLSK